MTHQGSSRIGSATEAEGGAAPERRCPRCDAPSHPDRLLCGACGADLAGDDLAVEVATVPPAPAARPRWRRRGFQVVGALVVTAAAVVVALTLAGLGPFAGGTDAPPPVVAPDDLDDEGAVRLSDVATLTTRGPENGRSFDAAALVDDDPATAWHADGVRRPAGAHEVVDLYLATPAWVTALVVTNGDQASPAEYAAAGRIAAGDLHLDGGVSYEVVFLDLGTGAQIVELPEPVLTTTLRLEITDAFPGERGDDPAVAGIDVRGHAADDEAATLAEERSRSHSAAGGVAVEVR